MEEPVPASSPGRKRSRKKFHTRLHRWLGMGSLAIVLVIAVTGILLNHTVALRLDEKTVSWPLLMQRYGMEPSGEPVVYPAGSHRLAIWDGRIFVDDRLVETLHDAGHPVGAGPVGENDLFVFVFPEFVITADLEGQVYDRLDVASLPPVPANRAAIRNGWLILETKNGKRYVLKQWIDLAADAGPEPAWFRPLAEVPSDYRRQLSTALNGEGMPLYRVVLDLHSGRLFGSVGVVLYDLAAVSLVILGITGVMLWFRRR